MKRQEKGFTLIEVLVVVSILGVLMGLVSLLVLRASSRQRELESEQLVKTYLPNSIERYKQEFKRLPPMSMKELNGIPRWKSLSIPENNSTNECNECLLVALRHPDFSAPLSDGDLPVTEAPFGNTDEDDFNQVPDGSDTAAAREILDAWGNPVVYIHKNKYGTPVRIVNHMGVEVDVEAVRKPDGAYYNPTSYQIISVGENGEQDVDDPVASDDIYNFKLEEE